MKTNWKLNFFVMLEILLLLLSSGPVLARTAETLSKGEAVMMLSKTGLMKKKISQLFSWTVGYDLSKATKIRLVPTINFIKTIPRRLPPDGKTVLEIQASVSDPEGPKNIAGVRADLSPIGRLSNTVLVDSGQFGDRTALDGVYTLQTSVAETTAPGEKEVPVAAANKKGWLALSKTNLEVSEDPVILAISITPEAAPADGKTVISLVVKANNPGGIEELESVTANLKSLGYEENFLLRSIEKDETERDGTYLLAFVIPDFIREGDYAIKIEAVNKNGGFAVSDYVIKVIQ